MDGEPAAIYFTHDWLKKNLKNEYYRLVTSLPTEIRITLNNAYTLIGFHAALNDMESYTCGTDRDLEVLENTYGSLEENIMWVAFCDKYSNQRLDKIHINQTVASLLLGKFICIIML